jgi:hypothetical protein
MNLMVVSSVSPDGACTVSRGTRFTQVGNLYYWKDAHAWHEMMVGTQGFGADGVLMLQTPFLLVALRALHKLKYIGEDVNEGVPTKHYEATVTLSDLETAAQQTRGIAQLALGNFRSPRSAIPASRQINISENLWIDKHERLIQIRMTQPWFIWSVGKDGSEGATQFMTAPSAAARTPQVVGHMTITDQLSNFGKALAPISPESSDEQRSNG